MPEWGTYSPSDFPMFSDRTYHRLFELLNRATWPAQITTLAAGVALLVLLRRTDERSGRIASGLLAAAWLVVAWAYFWEKYATIHWAGRHIAVLFTGQALWLGWVGVVRGRIVFAANEGIVARIGIGLAAFAVLAYPLLARLFGRPWAQTEVFGLAPDPTVAATLGVVLAALQVRWSLLVVPILWSVFSGLTLWTMKSPDAWVLPLLAVAGIVMAGVRQLRSGGSEYSRARAGD